MDFINGGELFMLLRKHRSFAESDARIWAAEILLALEYLHSMGIVYRDIKPENVLLDKGGHIKLTDFGLAREAADQTTAKEVAGSPYYMAPEVLLMQVCRGFGRAVSRKHPLAWVDGVCSARLGMHRGREGG